MFEAAKASEGIETDLAVLEAASILTTFAHGENHDPSIDAQRPTPVGQGTLAQVHPISNENGAQVSEPRWIRLGPAARQLSGRRLPPASKPDSKVKKYPPRDPAAMLNKPAGDSEHTTGFDAVPEPARAPKPNQKRVSKSRKSTKRKKKLTKPSNEQEDVFTQRPSIRFAIPDNLKNLLVDDWENITKTGLLVPLPSKAPANFIIDTYFQEEKQHRSLGPECEILEEFCSGMKVYFERALAKILLYRAERAQLSEVRKWWESGQNKDWEGRGVGDCYGGEHLARLLGKSSLVTFACLSAMKC